MNPTARKIPLILLPIPFTLPLDKINPQNFAQQNKIMAAKILPLKRKQQSVKILIIENQLIIAADVSLQLSKLGYDVIGINRRKEDAIKTIQSNRPDIVLLNIGLQGKADGLMAARIILETFQIPVVFISTHTNKATFLRAINAQPYAFISIPFERKDLQRGIELALNRMDRERLQSK